MIAVREGRGADVPLVIGTNAREGTVFRGPLDILPTTPPRIGAMFGRAPSLSRRPMHDAYPGLPKRHDALDFGGDYGFWYPSTLLADWHSRHAPTWSYRFDFAPRLLRITGIDATHGVELFTLFDLFDSPVVRAMTALGGRDAYARIGGRMRDAWLRFAETGATPESWPAYDEAARSTLIIDESIRVEQDPRRRQRLAWKAFLPVFEHLW
jgi:para-nitrobenzyl esterase